MPGERPRAQPGPPSGWPSGLRRCVQVAVSPGGVGSNPTPDKPAFWPAGQTRPSSPRHCLAPHTPCLPPPAPPPQEPSVLLSASFLPSWLQLQLLVFLPPRFPLAHPRPPSHSHGHAPPPAAPKHAAPRRLASPPRVAGAPTSAGERPTRSRSLASTSAPGRSPTGRHPVCPPHPPRRPACAPQSHRGGRAPALPARGVAACPRRFCALRPWPGHTCLPPARDTCLPAFLLASEHRSSWHQSVPGRVLLWGGSRSPTCPCSPPTGGRPAPPTFPGKPLPGPEPSPSRARSLPQPAVPEPGAALPNGPSSPAPPPRQSRTSGARPARAHEPGSHAFGSGPGGR